jgi:hypothetical protein
MSKPLDLDSGLALIPFHVEIVRIPASDTPMPSYGRCQREHR